MRKKLLVFAIVCMALSTLLGLINLAMGQTDRGQDANKLSDTAHCNQATAFSDGCAKAAHNHDNASNNVPRSIIVQTGNQTVGVNMSNASKAGINIINISSMNDHGDLVHDCTIIVNGTGVTLC